MDLEKYRYVLNYYRQFEPDLFKDICHNAYLAYWKRTHTDLFDQSIPLIFKVVRNQGIEDWRKAEQTNSRDYDPATYIKKEFISLPVNPESLIGEELPILSRGNPYEDMIAQELLECCYQVMIKGKRNVERAVEILELKLAGYGDSEIGRKLDISHRAVNKYTKNLEMLTNPINGSKLKITKQISLGSWEKKNDQEDYELEDENEFYQLYRHKESNDGLLVKVPAAKTNPYIK